MMINAKSAYPILTTAILLALPFLLLIILWATDPFGDTLVKETFSLSDLSAEQRRNINIAAERLTRTILKPGQSLSFNKAVGPRTSTSGFAPAPAYLGQESPSSFGGGICLVSSALYQAALETGMQIVKRYAHTRPISSIPPGLDATVWWGAKDLIIRNSTVDPVKLECSISPTKFTLAMKGHRNSKNQSMVRRLKTRQTASHLQVEVYRKTEGKEVLVSRDLYRLGGQPLPPDQSGKHDQGYQSGRPGQ